MTERPARLPRKQAICMFSNYARKVCIPAQLEANWDAETYKSCGSPSRKAHFGATENQNRDMDLDKILVWRESLHSSLYTSCFIASCLDRVLCRQRGYVISWTLYNERVSLKAFLGPTTSTSHARTTQLRLKQRREPQSVDGASFHLQSPRPIPSLRMLDQFLSVCPPLFSCSTHLICTM